LSASIAGWWGSSARPAVLSCWAAGSWGLRFSRRSYLHEPSAPPVVATLPAKSMSNKSIPKLVIHTIGGSSFAVIDTRDGNHIIKDGFKT
jgi:hypothetical protein